MPDENESLLRKIPAVNVLLEDAELQELAADVPRKILVDSVRASVEETRRLLLEEKAEAKSVDAIREAILLDAKKRVRAALGPHYRKVINATGIILHTGLGRAVLPPRALRQIQEELSGYSLLQVDTETGKRSKRDARTEWLLQQLTGGEAATVVNNNAAATMLVLNTVAKDKEVIVSRGQLVEIGGSFRLPEVMAASGATLVEVGTTNKTHARDYENAISDNTAALMRVHPSNYRIYGFTSEVPLEELEKIAHTHGLVLIDDVGAGALIDFSRFGFEKEPTLPDSIRTGADIVTSSADKLMGASQGGVIIGRADLIQAIRKNPLARAMRVDKLTLAALEATLTLFLDEALALREIPTLRMLHRELSEVSEQAERITRTLKKRISAATITTIEGSSQTGSGSLPEQNLPTRLVAITPEEGGPDALALRLRRYSPPIFTRIQKDQVLIDPRTLLEGEEDILIRALGDVLGPGA
jgi:L-seryl-tRNA(Ser) seleniumtransferase